MIIYTVYIHYFDNSFLIKKQKLLKNKWIKTAVKKLKKDIAKEKESNKNNSKDFISFLFIRLLI